MKEWKSREELQQEGFLVKVGMAVVALILMVVLDWLGVIDLKHKPEEKEVKKVERKK